MTYYPNDAAKIGALIVENEDLRAELAELRAAQAEAGGTTEAPSGAEQADAGSTTEQADAGTEAPAAPSYEDLKAQVDAIPDNITPEEYYARVHEIQRRQGAGASQPAEQLTGEDLDKALAEVDGAESWQEFYSRMAQIPGAVETAAPGGGQRVF